ncbi:MAG: DUF3604 domain-containing protein [Candidatus Binatia bacterium]
MRHSRSVLAVLFLLLAACRGQHQGPGDVTTTAVPAPVVAAREARQAAALEELAPDAATRPDKQILFGDLHVHTTFSPDAFMRSLPMLHGEGAHPPADACDYARFCSDLDFWSINDHAEGVSPQHWQETKDSIRQCNAVAGDPQNPDVVAFLGWEWTQVGQTPDDHYGHKNVIFRDLGDDQVPSRPISALSQRLVGALRAPAPLWQRIQLPLFDYANRQRYFDFGKYQEELNATPLCPVGVDTRQLPADCHEAAETPEELFEKLSQWGFDTLVIPHGTTWGLYTPPGTTWDKQLSAQHNDPEKQTLFEIYSGHGNSEEFRRWHEVTFAADGTAECPMPTADHVPCCWQAGEIIRSRCGDTPADECEQRVGAARANYLAAGVAGRITVPGSTIEDWGDCGQCRDCFNPSFNFRPGNSAQYILSLTNFEDPADPKRAHFGFIASSDNHTARPGTGYKEYGRRQMTEAAGPRDETWARRVFGKPAAATDESVPFDPNNTSINGFQLVDLERQASFFMTGGLVAVHSAGRDRNAIWDSLKQREVYATSGERILLWFDLLNGPEGDAPMGAAVTQRLTPRFRARAAGSFKQRPGCPEHSVKALSPERLDHLCRGECYNPSDERHRITRIEVVRVRPQATAGEPIGQRIEDPWRRFDCPPNADGCAIEFDDPDFTVAGRDASYYVRAIQEPTLAVNSAGLRCEYDASGTCTKVNPCFGDYRTNYDDDCLSENEERAWSSPIYLSAAR